MDTRKTEKTLRQHLKEAAILRWKGTSTEDRKAHSAKMNIKRWAGHIKKVSQETDQGSHNIHQEDSVKTSNPTSTGEKEKPTPEA